MLGLNPATWFIGMPHEWAVFFLSMLPITELRASIPIGIEVYGLPIWKTWVMAVIGDITPAMVILYFLPKMHDWVIKQKILGGILAHQLKKAEKKFSGKYAKYGAIALIVFIGIPLPFTGAWTGSLASFVFNIPFKKSWYLILIGVCLAATVVTLITISAGGMVRAIFVG